MPRLENYMETDGIVLFFDPIASQRREFVTRGRDEDFGLAHPDDYDERVWPL